MITDTRPGRNDSSSPGAAVVKHQKLKQMKHHNRQTLLTRFLPSVSTAVAVAGFFFFGQAGQAQPSISGLNLPNAVNIGNGYGVGAVQFQGAVPPNVNQLTFQLASGTGVTSVSVKLTSTTLPGVTTTTTLTPAYGLTTSGNSQSETVTVSLSGDMVYTALITAADSGGSSSSSVTFDTINPNYFTFEAEDFDYNGGQYFDSLPPGTFPYLDAYAPFAATIGIDCNNHTGGEAAYRPNPLETEPASDTPRLQYADSGYPDFDVGFNSTGDWGNYTRHYPAGIYNIYLRGSGGNGPQTDACTIGMLTSGYGTTNQTTNSIGTFSVAGLGWQTFTWCPASDTNGNLVAWAAGGDQETLRFTVAKGNCNENFYMLVPAAPSITPATTNIYQGNPSTLSIFPFSSGTAAIQWQTDNGSDGATWSTISGATSTNYVVPNSSLSQKVYEYRILLTITSNSSPIVVTSSVIALNILAPSKPVVVQNTTPATDNEVVGSISTFTASFAGNQPIVYQWEISTNGGSTFANLGGQTNATLSVTNVAPVTNVLYELVASNSLGSTASTPTSLTVSPAPPRPPLQLAGDLIVNLENADLSTNIAVWTNRTDSSASVGDFQTQAKSVLNVATNTPAWDALPILALDVNGSAADAVVSALNVPAEIIGSKPCSVEVWAYASSVTVSGNNTVFGYGNQGGSGAQYEDREFDYNNNNSGNGAFSGNFGGDFNWSTTPSAGVWHFLAWTYDGANVVAYLDGRPDKTNGSQTMSTVESLAVVGGGIANGGPNLADVFNGYIGAARLSSGVLTAAQVSNNFAAGLTATAPVEVGEPTPSPTNTLVTEGSSIVLTAADMDAAYPYTYQWLEDNGSGGQTWAAISGATNATYTVNTTGFANGSYEFEVVLSNAQYSISAISSPITIQVVSATPPELVQDTTPSSVTTYVTENATLTASFSGEAPLVQQWQVSADGTNYTAVANGSGTNITITSDAPLTNYYRLYASNPLGTNTSTPALVIFQAAPALPAPGVLQTAGDIIVNLQAGDLTPGEAVWQNATINSNSVGNFAPPSGGALNVSTGAPYLYHRINSLFVDDNIAQAVQSAMAAPAEIVQNNPVSVEAWIFAVAVNQQNSCVVGYGLQGQSEAPQEDREFTYEAGFGSGSTSGDFGNFDSGWSTTPNTNTWHYLAWAWDGTTVNCYVDGNFDHAQSPGSPLITADTVIGVGGGLGQSGSGPNITVDAFQGYIAAARVESGVLSSEQINSNYTAGLFGTVPTAVYPPAIQYAATNGSLTLTWGAGATLVEATNILGPWHTVNATSPYVVNPHSGPTNEFFKLSYSQ